MISAVAAPANYEELQRCFAALSMTGFGFFHTIRGFPHTRRQSRFFLDFDATLQRARAQNARTIVNCHGGC
jgi:hypothetical protein